MLSSGFLNRATKLCATLNFATQLSRYCFVGTSGKINNSTRVMSTGAKGLEEQPKVLSTGPLENGRWIQLRKINYRDPTGNERAWEMAVRTTRSPDTEIDAVGIVAVLNRPSKPKEVVLTEQFRPPLGRKVIDFPAGLIDPNEKLEVTAVRELKEETGYKGTFNKLSATYGVLANDPGMSNATMALAIVDVDLNDPQNKNPIAELDEGEFITTFSVPLQGLLEHLHKLAQGGAVIDSRLYNFAMGLEVARSL